MNLNATNTALVVVNCSNNQLTASALNDLFRTLPKVTGTEHSPGGNINIVGNPGAGDCDGSIAREKGWGFLLDNVRSCDTQQYFKKIRRHIGVERMQHCLCLYSGRCCCVCTSDGSQVGSQFGLFPYPFHVLGRSSLLNFKVPVV